jgi:hypothetical protein
VIDNADVIQLSPPAIDRGRNLVIRHQPDRADPRRVVADRAQAEADLVIVREATATVSIRLSLGIPAQIGKIPLALGAMLSIPPVDLGDHHIDTFTCRTFDLLHLGHLNLLERLQAMSDELILGRHEHDQPLSKMESSTGFLLSGGQVRSFDDLSYQQGDSSPPSDFMRPSEAVCQSRSQISRPTDPGRAGLIGRQEASSIGG